MSRKSLSRPAHTGRVAAQPCLDGAFDAIFVSDTTDAEEDAFFLVSMRNNEMPFRRMEVIRWNQVESDKDGLYEPVTGGYTAPKHGVYQ